MARSLSLQLYTFKDGLLARAAHDLRLRVERVTLGEELGQLTVEVDPSSIRVDGALVKGELAAARLSPADRVQIEQTLWQEVLRVSRFPELRFQAPLPVGEPGTLTLHGELLLAGKTLPLEIVAERAGDAYEGAFELQPSRWGIPAYKALLGAIRLQDRIRVVFRVADALPA